MEMVTDPNGQISITYKDLLRDKVIATSLAGNRPSAYDSLMESQSDTLLMGVITSHSDTLLTVEPNVNNAYLVNTEGDFLFRYELLPTSFIIENCTNEEVCYDCKYDIVIRINDVCSNSPLQSKTYQNYSLPFLFDSPLSEPD